MTYRTVNEELSTEYFDYFDVFDDSDNRIGSDQVPTAKWLAENLPVTDSDGDGVPDGEDADPDDPAIQ
jgi:hypothetical protein